MYAQARSSDALAKHPVRRRRVQTSAPALEASLALAAYGKNDDGVEICHKALARRTRDPCPMTNSRLSLFAGRPIRGLRVKTWRDWTISSIRPGEPVPSNRAIGSKNRSKSSETSGASTSRTPRPLTDRACGLSASSPQPLQASLKVCLVLIPNDLPCLEAVGERLANFERYFGSIAHHSSGNSPAPISTHWSRACAILGRRASPWNWPP